MTGPRGNHRGWDRLAKSVIVLAVMAALGYVAVQIFDEVFYTVDDSEQVLILRFGEVIDQHSGPGRHRKTPFVDSVLSYEKGVLDIEGSPLALADVDLQPLVIDYSAHYRITDPVQFRRTLQTPGNANSRLGDLIGTGLRKEVSGRKRAEIVVPGPGSASGVVNGPSGEKGRASVTETETQAEIAKAALVDVRRIFAEEPELYGVEIIDLTIRGATVPE